MGCLLTIALVFVAGAVTLTVLGIRPPYDGLTIVLALAAGAVEVGIPFLWYSRRALRKARAPRV